MKRFVIYFEIFGKKMKYECNMLNKDRAKQIISDKIIIRKVEEIKDESNVIDDIFNLFNMKK